MLAHRGLRLGDLPKGQTVIRRAVLLQRRPQRLNGAAQHHDLGPQVLEGPRGVVELILLTNPHRHSCSVLIDPR